MSVGGETPLRLSCTRRDSMTRGTFITDQDQYPMAKAIEQTSAQAEELDRVGEQVSERLRRRGVFVHARDSTEDLATVFEAIEQFEAAVESRGGDLMMDEPPAGHSAQPDNPDFALPERNTNETALAFASRVESITAKLRA